MRKNVGKTETEITKTIGGEVNVIVQEIEGNPLVDELNTFLASVDEESKNQQTASLEQEISQAGTTYSITKKSTSTVSRYFVFKSSESSELYYFGKETVNADSFDAQSNSLAPEKETSQEDNLRLYKRSVRLLKNQAQ